MQLRSGSTKRPSVRTLLTAAGLLLVLLGLSGRVAADPASDAFNKQDFATALRIWKAEAESGSPTSPVRIAEMYRYGWGGVKQDVAEAVRWYRIAAERNNVFAMLGIAEVYRSGIGVKRDHAEAARWYLLAGEHCCAAHRSLAEIYAKGEGVPQNFVEAYKWYTLTASSKLGRGDPDDLQAYNARVLAERDAMAAAAKMTPEQIAEAEKLAREWKPKR